MLCTISALILSLIVPGTGQIFNGSYILGSALALIFIFARPVILPLCIRFANFEDEPSLLKFIYVFNILFAVFIIITALDAALGASSCAKASLLQAFYCLMLALILTGAGRALKSEFFVFTLSGRKGLYSYIFTPKVKKR